MLETATIEATETEMEGAALLSVVADPVRWSLLSRLAASGTQCVCELQKVSSIASNLLSYHLRVLRESGLVTTARRGRWVDYTLAEDAPDRLRAALPTSVECVEARCRPCR